MTVGARRTGPGSGLPAHARAPAPHGSDGPALEIAGRPDPNPVRRVQRRSSASLLVGATGSRSRLGEHAAPPHVGGLRANRPRTAATPKVMTPAGAGAPRPADRRRRARRAVPRRRPHGA